LTRFEASGGPLLYLLPEAPSVKFRRLDGEAPPTLRGLTTGFVKVRKDCELKPCAVLGSIFPSWLPVLTELGFDPVLILLRSDAFLEEVETFVGDKCVIWCGSD
jgi:hypothetical protein